MKHIYCLTMGLLLSLNSMVLYGAAEPGNVDGLMDINRAAAAGDLLRVQYLVKNGADINAKDNNGNAPHCIALYMQVV